MANKRLITLLAFFLLLASSVYAQNGEIAIQANIIKSDNKLEQDRAYNKLKTLYMQSMLSGATQDEEASLLELIVCGKILNKDVQGYEKEYKTKFNKPQSKLEAVPHKNNNTLNNHTIENETLELLFSNPISSSDVKFFALNTPTPKRLVIDVNAALQKSFSVSLHGGISIKVAQFAPQTLRIVTQGVEESDFEFKMENNKLTINPNKNKTKKIIPSVAIEEIKPVEISQKVIVIDPGHGGKDSGAVGYNDIKEKDIVFKTSNMVVEKLRSMGYTVHITRNTDDFIELKDRTKFANKYKANAFISIHANAVDGEERRKTTYGLECYFLSPERSEKSKMVAAKENVGDVQSQKEFASKFAILDVFNREHMIKSNFLGLDIQKNMIFSLKEYDHIKDNGVKGAPFWVLVGTQMPAVLVEIGYATHPVEGARLADEKYLEKIADGVALGIESYFRKN